jgi:hypothetical protein
MHKNNGFDFEQFNIYQAESVYILGLIWSDGSFDLPYRTGLHGNWRYNFQNKRQPTWKDQLLVRASSKDFVNFLLHHDYKTKGESSADRILSIIPNNLKHYFFRGVIDGDGSFQCGKKTIRSNGKKAFGCYSTYKQNWNYFEQLLKSLDISYKICRRNRIRKNKIKEQKSSSIEFYKIHDIIKFGNYIYNDFEQDGIGLKRKYNKFQEIVHYAHKPSVPS